jgi:hypothetical protein
MREELAVSTDSPRVVDLIWRGHMQLGDEPGIYGDCDYMGLAVEIPIEVHPYPEKSQSSADSVTFIIEAAEVRVYGGYPGHPVSIFAFMADGHNRWSRRVLASGRLTNENGGHLRLLVEGEVPRFVSIRVEIDTTIPPGLYDEIVVRRLSMESTTHFGQLGFRYTSGGKAHFGA